MQFFLSEKMASCVHPFKEGEDDWTKWLKKFEEFLITCEVKKVLTARQKLAYLRLHGGFRVNEILDHQPTTEEESVLNQSGVWSVSRLELDEYKRAVNVLTSQLEEKINPMLEEVRFRKLAQGANESGRNFALRVRVQAGRCKLDNPEVEIKRQFALGTADDDVKARYFRGKLATIDEMIERQSSNETLRELKKKDPMASSSSEINALTAAPTNKLGDCFKCGQQGHFAARCPLDTGRRNQHLRETPYSTPRGKSSVTCFLCRKKGHVKRACPNLGESSKQEKINHVKSEESAPQNSSPKDEYLFFLGGGDEVHCEIAGVKVYLLVDSGCVSNILNVKTWEMLKARGAKVTSACKDVKKSFKAYGTKEPLSAVGTFEAPIAANNKKVTARFFVLDVPDRCLLGSNTAKALGILKIDVR